MPARRLMQAGFTLVEMIIVMVITGIIGGMVAMFIKAPVQQYVDLARRAELTDIADTAFYRLARDIRTAVPNSVSSPSTTAVEFLPTKDGGRYRNTASAVVGVCGGSANNSLNFSPDVVTTCFQVIGSAVSAVSGDYLVVGSTQSDASLPYWDVPASSVLRLITGSSGVGGIVLANSGVLPAAARLDSQRFQVIDGAQQAVRYACETLGTNAAGDGTGVLRRYWNYGFTHTTGAVSAVLASNVSSCNFTYDIVNQRNALLAITLQFTKASETVSLYQEIHVGNAP